MLQKLGRAPHPCAKLQQNTAMATSWLLASTSRGSNLTLADQESTKLKPIGKAHHMAPKTSNDIQTTDILIVENEEVCKVTRILKDHCDDKSQCRSRQDPKLQEMVAVYTSGGGGEDEERNVFVYPASKGNRTTNIVS